MIGESIRRINAGDFSVDWFMENHFFPEVPLIITNVSDNWDLSKWSYDSLIHKIKESRLTKNKLWFQSSDAFEDLDSITPDFINESLSEKHAYKKKEFVRIWINEPGDRTLLHIDANGLFAFNLQLKGQKLWKIYPPTTEFKMYSFTNIPHLKYNECDLPSPLKSKEVTFTLNEGEMIFLPAYWYHAVAVANESTMNINWVGTRKEPLQNPAQLREGKLIKVLLPLTRIKLISRLVDLVCGSMERDYFKNYGGNGGIQFLTRRASPLGRLESFLTFSQELIRFPVFLSSKNRIIGYSKSHIQKI